MMMSELSGFTHESARNETVEWYTPPEIFEALGITFDLDPCAAPGAFVPAKTFYTQDMNGLEQPWHGLAWVNPPYGRETPAWLEKLAEHGQGIALVFSRTDTKWFQSVAARASAVCFVAGRMKGVN